MTELFVRNPFHVPRPAIRPVDAVRVALDLVHDYHLDSDIADRLARDIADAVNLEHHGNRYHPGPITTRAIDAGHEPLGPYPEDPPFVEADDEDLDDALTEHLNRKGQVAVPGDPPTQHPATPEKQTRDPRQQR